MKVGLLLGVASIVVGLSVGALVLAGMRWVDRQIA